LESLVSGYEGKGFTICMDRFYTTLSTVNFLSEKGFGVFGAIMRNRVKLDQNIIDEISIMERGDAKFYCSNDEQIILTCWKDSKVVLLVSNKGDDSLMKTTRNIKDENQHHKTIEIKYPTNIKNYSENSKGVDHFDQMMSYYARDHRSVKWHTRVSVHLLGVAIHNSFILYRFYKKNKIKSYLDFQKSIIKSLETTARCNGC